MTLPGGALRSLLQKGLGFGDLGFGGLGFGGSGFRVLGLALSKSRCKRV